MESGYYNSLYLAGLQGVFAPVHAAYHSRSPTLTLSLFAYLPRVVPTDYQTEARFPGLISKPLQSCVTHEFPPVGCPSATVALSPSLIKLRNFATAMRDVHTILFVSDGLFLLMCLLKSSRCK